MVKEYKRTCKNCGQVWHSLVSREKKLKRDKTSYGIQKAGGAMQQLGGSMQQCGTCGMCGGGSARTGAQVYTQTSRNIDAASAELARLKRCPNCG